MWQLAKVHHKKKLCTLGAPPRVDWISAFFNFLIVKECQKQKLKKIQKNTFNIGKQVSPTFLKPSITK